MASKIKEILNNMVDLFCNDLCRIPYEADSHEELNKMCNNCPLDKHYDKLLEHGVDLERLNKSNEKHEKGYNPWQE